MYINCHSYYSLRYGTLSVEELVEQAHTQGLSELVLTDINSSQGIMDFVNECQTKQIKAIAGIEFRKNSRCLYTGIARNNKGFKALNEFLTEHNLNKTELPDYAPELEHVYFVYPYGNRTKEQLKEHEFIGVKPDQLPFLITSEFANDTGKLLVHYPVTLRSSDDHEVHKCLRAIDENLLISQLHDELIARSEEVFIRSEKLSKLYTQYPQIIENTKQLLQDCELRIDFKKAKNKHAYSNAENPQKAREQDRITLEKVTYKGLQERYGLHNKEAFRRVKKELEIIHKLNFSAYFLIAWDLIRYTMSKDIYHVGRGSGANSTVAYCLNITDVDPIDLDLYFERFINPQRSSPPDFDIDFSWKDRDTIQQYLFKKYGEDHRVALLGATTTFKDKAIYRELGKVYGLPKEEIDKLANHLERDVEADHITRKIKQTGERIVNFPNIRSIHAGGIIIAEEPLTQYTALDLPPKGYPTTQWDMYVAEMINFEKLDILSQRGIGHIRECAELVKRNKSKEVDIHEVERFKKDPKVNKKLYEGDAIGCFYIESPAMRGLLKKLRCNEYLRLVAASSIIRPGVASSGMMREYIQRFHYPDSFSYLHPVFEEQLKETYGVMVYQEDVIKICHHFAGLDLADADILRRAMSGKYRSKAEFRRIMNTFRENCMARGYSEALVKEVWRQISSFAGYAFSKAHSASYAVESYQSLYLKTYYPLEFMVAVINNFGGFYRTWVYVNEARKLGANIELPCINKSTYKTTIYQDNVYLGFVHIKSLESSVAEQILQEREHNGVYTDLADLAQRINIGIEQLKVLIRIGALRFTGKTKSILMWEAYLYFNKCKRNEDNTQELFRRVTRKFEMPELRQNKLEDAYDEMELLGFPVSMTKISLLKTNYRGNTHAQGLIEKCGQRVRIIGDLVNKKNVYTKRRQWMHFGCFVDEHGNFFDTVNFPTVVEQYPFTGEGVYLIEGIVSEEFGFPNIEVEKMARLPYTPDPRFTEARKFGKDIRSQ